jgi:hypothetical protein
MVAIFMKKQAKRSDLFILSDTLFKLSAGFYLIIFFLIHSFPGLDFEDTVILRFSGVIILFDIDYIGLIDVISKYSPWVSSVMKPLEKLQSP